MKAPKTIFLTTEDDDKDSFLWCEDQIDEDDIQYIKYSEYKSLEHDNKKLQKRIDDLIEERGK